MRFLVPIGLAFSLIVAIGTLVWGWPGAWALLALLPGVLLGGSVAHVIGARRGDTGLRVGVAVLGFMLGGFGTALTLLFFAAAADPQEVRHAVAVTARAPASRAWELVEDWRQRPRWLASVRELEPIGLLGPPAPGTRYRVTLDLGTHTLDVEQEVVAFDPGRRLAWRTDLPEGTKLLDFREEAVLTTTGEGVRLEYALSYRVEGVLDRLAHRIQVRDLFAGLVEASGRAFQSELAH